MHDFHITMPQNACGELLLLTENTLVGWAYLLDAIEPCCVEILGDGDVLNIVRADWNLGNQFKTLSELQQKHGFVVVLSEHQLRHIGRIEARLANTTQQLAGIFFPHTVDDLKTPMMFGQVENHGGLKVWGWAWNPQTPQITQNLIVSYQGQEIARIKADIYRSDLAEQKIGTGRHGFEWTLPLTFADGQIHQIEVFDTQGNLLNGSPFQVFVPEQGIEHWVNQFDIPNKDKLLLNQLVERYQRYVPLSLGFETYADWFNRFGKAPDFTVSNQKILIVIDGTGGNLDISLQSLYRQTHTNWIALIRGRMAELLYHDDVRLQSVSETHWHGALQGQLNVCDAVSYLLVGDYLAENALATALHRFTDAQVQVVYSDSDMPDERDGRKPWFKPDFDIDLFLHTSALHDCFMTRPCYLMGDESVLLRDCRTWPAFVLTKLGEPTSLAIKHLPWVLYHRAKLDNGQALSSNSAMWLDVHAAEAKIDVNHETMRIQWSMPENHPRVSLIIPTRDRCDLLKNCITSLRTTDYPNLEYIVMDNDSVESETLGYFEKLKSEGVHILKHTGTFNFSAMNNRAVAMAQSELIALINNDIEVLAPNWLDEMVRELLRPNVGAVGAKLLWDNDFVQHGGVLLGQHGLAGHIGNDWHTDDSGYFGINQCVRGVSAVTAACLLCRREDYVAVGGLNEKELPVNFNDVDLCLRLGQLGKRILWTPHARLRHLESASRGRDLLPAQQARFEREKRYMREKWQALFTGDPFYNYNLNLERYSHAGLAIPPRHPATLNAPLNIIG